MYCSGEISPSMLLRQGQIALQRLDPAQGILQGLCILFQWFFTRDAAVEVVHSWVVLLDSPSWVG